MDLIVVIENGYITFYEIACFFKEYTKESTAITETDARLMWVWKCMENEEVKNNRYLNDTLLNLFLT